MQALPTPGTNALATEQERVESKHLRFVQVTRFDGMIIHEFQSSRRQGSGTFCYTFAKCASV